MDKKIIITIVLSLLVGLTIVYSITVLTGVQTASTANNFSNNLSNQDIVQSTQGTESTANQGTPNNYSNVMVGGC